MFSHRAKRPPRRLLVTSAVAVAALAGPTVGHALANDAGHFSISDAHVTEPKSGSALMTFTINYQRDNTTTPSTGTVDWITSDLTAQAAAGDYQATKGHAELTTTETAGQPGGSHMTQTISVPVNADQLIEGPETFRVTLYNPGTPAASLGYRTDIVDSEGIGTIDPPPTPVEDDHHSSPVIITAPASQPQPQPQPQPQVQPVNITVQGPAGQVQGNPPPQTIVQQPSAAQPANPNRGDQGSEDDHFGPTMGMQFHRLTDVASVRLRCPATEESCSGRILLQLSGKTLGSAHFKIDGGDARWVRIRLTRSERRALRRAGGFYFRAIALDAAGNRETTERGFQV
ncbi:MAG: hypothetical protein ACJ786_30410 [Catenulispora sp.]|jgi:hypothetical protein